MGAVQNERIVWAYAELQDGDSSGQLLIIGLTDTGLEFLKAGEGSDKETLVIDPPPTGFANVRKVVIFNEKDTATLNERFREVGVLTSEAS